MGGISDWFDDLKDRTSDQVKKAIRPEDESQGGGYRYRFGNKKSQAAFDPVGGFWFDSRDREARQLQKYGLIGEGEADRYRYSDPFGVVYKRPSPGQPPALPPPPEMPSRHAGQERLARKRYMARQNRRGGRLSTVLTSDQDVLG